MACHLVIPAAGSGQRFGGPTAKQYADLCGTPLIERTLRQLGQLVDFQSVSVGLAAGDPGWDSQLVWRRVAGGASRAETVLCILESLVKEVQPDDWVWVHDAVRPFVSSEMAGRLQQAMDDNPDCIVAGVPVTDTLKQIDGNQQVVKTLDRSGIWRAQTPQISRYAPLLEALRVAVESGADITDEAGAMELQGIPVTMVLGSVENIKITTPDDMRLAEIILRTRKEN